MTLTSGVLWRHYVPVPLSVNLLLILLASNQPYCACAYIWDGILSQGESKIYSYFFLKKSLCRKSCGHIIKTPTRLSIVCLVDRKGIWASNLSSLVTVANKGGFVWFTFKQRNLVPRVSHLTALNERGETLAHAGHVLLWQLKTSRKVKNVKHRPKTSNETMLRNFYIGI